MSRRRSVGVDSMLSDDGMVVPHIELSRTRRITFVIDGRLGELQDIDTGVHSLAGVFRSE